MARSFYFDNQAPISLGDYLDFVLENVDENDVESLADSAPMLHRLSLTNDLFNDVLLEPLKSIGGEVQGDNRYTDATFMLGAVKDGRLRVRGNVWKLPSARGGVAAYETELYSYELPHDHNFDFLTVGYSGPGYTTDMFSYESDGATLHIGDRPALQFVETTTLPVGKVMLYEKSKDIHTQRPPPSISVSLNLICATEDQSLRQQYYFDTNRKCVSGYVDGMIDSRVGMIKIVGQLGIHEALQPLVDVATSSPCLRTKAASIEAILLIDPGQRDKLYSSFGSSNDQLIRGALQSHAAAT